MSNKQKKKLTPVQQQYHSFAKEREPRRPVLANCLRAFLVGGLICILGQGIFDFFRYVLDFSEKAAINPMVVTLIFLAIILTVCGVYDKMAQWAGAGTAVPITGFANAMAAAAIEHRTEGFVLGVGGKMFKLAGAVIVFGVFSAFIVALLKTTLAMLGVI
ncbi:stage V sporulation protein AC [Peptococcaceae bacterium]|nr:stage V sporulation protein AC [Peptococcaceae bacterium]